jgi:two-component system sensor histidine kinase PilS (NtrC family)
MTGSEGLRDAREETALGFTAGRRAEWLLLGRLVLTSVSFGIAAGLEGPRGELTEEAYTGLFWTVAIAFGATAISATLVRRLRSLKRFATVQIALDVAIVTSLVFFSGANGSLFAFLYVLVTMYGALLFERWGAIGAATLSAICYGGVLLTTSQGHDASWGVLGADWAIHVGALYLVGALATMLAGEVRRTGQALDRRTDDLIRLRNLHERTVESIMSGLATIDERGCITYFNPEAEQITGVSASEARGSHVDDVIPGVSALALRSADAAEGPQRARMRFANRRGDEIHLGVAASILWDEYGEEAGHVLIFQDVTQVVEMEGQLRRSERLAAVGELAAKMAHEIRNPLAAISGSVQVLRSGMRDHEVDPEHEQLMGIVVREAHRLGDLIQDFLSYARPRPPALDRVALDDLVEEVTKLCEPSLPENVRLVVGPPRGLVAEGDRDQLKQVLWNLCLNAAQAMPDGGELRVSLDAALREPPQARAGARRNGERGDARSGDAPRWVEIVVADTGVGIPFEIQDQIFEPFFTTKKEGSGLGLATVHRIVESHGGMLQVQSRPGEGTVFRISLPEARS